MMNREMELINEVIAYIEEETLQKAIDNKYRWGFSAKLSELVEYNQMPIFYYKLLQVRKLLSLKNMEEKVFTLELVEIDGYPLFKKIEGLKVGSIGVYADKTYTYDGYNWRCII